MQAQFALWSPAGIRIAGTPCLSCSMMFSCSHRALLWKITSVANISEAVTMVTKKVCYETKSFMPRGRVFTWYPAGRSSVVHSLSSRAFARC